MKVNFTHLVCLLDKFIEVWSLLRESKVNLGFFTEIGALPTLTCNGVPPVTRLIDPPEVLAPWSEQRDFSTSQVTLLLVLPEEVLTNCAKFSLFFVLLQTCWTPLVTNPKHFEHKGNFLAGGVSGATLTLPGLFDSSFSYCLYSNPFILPIRHISQEHFVSVLDLVTGIT